MLIVVEVDLVTRLFDFHTKKHVHSECAIIQSGSINEAFVRGVKLPGGL